MEILFPDDLKEYIDTHEEGTYTLLDVRQPGEYEEGHLPGAKLIPLPELGDSLELLDLDRPTVVYCAVGGRSRTAAQFLLNRGFRNVLVLEGGIDAWEEGIASSPVEFPEKFLRGDEGPEEVVRLACLMEEGLKRFHLAIRERTKDPALAELLGRLVRAEESHERTLLTLLPDRKTADAILREISGIGDMAEVEGGIDLQDYLEKNERFLYSIQGYLELTMMVETQALDLYLRLAERSGNAASREIFFRIGDEEKTHLAMLGKYFDGLLQKS